MYLIVGTDQKLWLQNTWSKTTQYNNNIPAIGVDVCRYERQILSLPHHNRMMPRHSSGSN